MRVSIHKIKNSEEKETAKLIKRTIKELSYTYHRYVPDNLEKYYSGSGGIFYTASVGGKIIGCAGVFRLSKRKGEIQRFFIAKGYRGKSVGGRLLAKIRSFCLMEGISTLILRTPKANIKAQMFYEKEGFKRYGEKGKDFCYWLSLTKPS